MIAPTTTADHCFSCANRVAAGARAYDGEARVYCYPCAEARERSAILNANDYAAYLSDDGRHLTTWTGAPLARITYLRKGRHNIGGTLYRFNAIDPAGGRWYGTSPGPGMLARMHRSKQGPAAGSHIPAGEYATIVPVVVIEVTK